MNTRLAEYAPKNDFSIIQILEHIEISQSAVADLDIQEADLIKMINNNKNQQNFKIEHVLELLKEQHRNYLNKKLPEIEQSIAQIFKSTEGVGLLEKALAFFFNQYKAKLINHINMEETLFFPYLDTLIAIKHGQKLPVDAQYSSIENFIDHHDPIEDELKEVNKIILQNQDPNCNLLSYKIFLNQIQHFEVDLRKHALIEDFLLVPLAKELEAEIKN